MAETFQKKNPKGWQFYTVAMTIPKKILKVDNFTLWPWLFKNIFLKVDNCTLLMWSFLTIFRHGHDISKKISGRLTILHYGCDLFWQFSAMAMTFQKKILEGWQFYTMAVTFFDKFLQWLWCSKTIWQFYSFFLISILTIFPLGHAFIYQEQPTYGRTFL